MKKNKGAKPKQNSKRAIISHSLANHEKHPFFVRTRNEAKAFLKKVGLPAGLRIKTAK